MHVFTCSYCIPKWQKASLLKEALVVEHFSDAHPDALGDPGEIDEEPRGRRMKLDGDDSPVLALQGSVDGAAQVLQGQGIADQYWLFGNY